MRSLRLLFVVQRYGPEVRGGAEQAAREVAQRLAARDHHVEVLTTTARSYVDWSGDLPAGTHDLHGVTVHRLAVRPHRDPDVFGRLHHRVEAATPPVAPELQRAWLDAQGPSVPELGPWLDARADRFDVVVFFTYLYATTTHGLPVAARHTATALVPCAHDEPPLALPVFDRVAHLADVMLFLTPEEATLVRSRFRISTPHHIVGLGTEPSPALAEPPAGERAGRFGDAPYLVYVGRIDPSKGTSWLVESFAAMKAARPSSLRLVLVGEVVVPPVEHPDVVVVEDADDDVRDAMLAGAVALVHPSPFESFGMVLTEAWANGTPVIAFAGNDVLRGHVERSGGGVLVSTAAELAAAAELLTRDRAVRDALGEAGRAHVTEHYAWPAVTSAWERALWRAAARGPGRPPRVGSAPLAPVAAPPGIGPSAEPASDDRHQRQRRPTPAGDLPPRWLALPLAVTLGLLLGASVTGVVSALLGVCTPIVVAAGALLVGGPAAILAAASVPRSASSGAVHAAAAFTVCLAVALMAWNGVNHGQHLVVDRDPGVYVTTARHLMDRGDLLIPGPSGPFAGAAGVATNPAGFSRVSSGGTLEAQFPHLTAVLLAMGGWVSEPGLFLVPAALASLGLLCLYAWGCTVLGARWAAVATTVTGATLPFMMSARDAYSEPITSVLVFGGLWLLHLAHRSGRRPLWLVAGLMLGATSMARVDGYLYLVPLALALAVTARMAPSDRHRGDLLGGVALCGLGLAATSAISLWDTITTTGSYFEDALAARLPSMLGAAAAIGIAAWFGAPLLWRRRPSTQGSGLEPTPWLRGALAAVAVGGLGVFAWAWWVRPDTEGLPAVAHHGMDVLSLLPQAATLSLHWLGWYLGPLPLAVGLVGLIGSVWRLARATELDPAVIGGLGAVLVTLLLYLWSPNITPDQPWAMRRFVSVALPGLAVGIAATCRAVWRRGHHRDASQRRVWVGSSLALALALASAASAAAVTWPVRSARAQVPMRERMHKVCDALGPDAAVLVSIDGLLAPMLSVPVAAWCKVPSAGGTAELTVRDLARLAISWQDEGRRLVVLSSSTSPLFGTLGGSHLVSRVLDLDPAHPTSIEPTLTRRPDRIVVDAHLVDERDGSFAFHLYEIDPARARSLLGSFRSSAPDGDQAVASGRGGAAA